MLFKKPECSPRYELCSYWTRPTLKADHEFATGSAQCPTVCPIVLFCAHMVFLMMLRGKGRAGYCKENV